MRRRVRSNDTSGRRVAAVVATAALLLVGCPDPEARRHRQLIGLIEARAAHVEPDVHDQIARGLVVAEQASGVDALLLLSVVHEESRYRPGARGPRGGLGLMQVRPPTGRDVAQRNEIALDGDASLLDPAVNLLVGATYLAELKEAFGSWDLALTAYNRGPTRTRRLASRVREGHPSSRYAERILRRYEALIEELGSS